MLRACMAGAVAGIVVALSIPREYSVTVLISPESGRSVTTGLSNAASMLGLSDFSQSGDVDAMNIMLFPEILDSDPFALELYAMTVTPDDAEPLPLNRYIASRRMPWWQMLMQLPGRAVRGVTVLLRGENEEEDQTVNPFRLTAEQTSRLKALKESMTAVVDKKSGVTTITVTMQDAVVAATVADSVVRKLQEYISAYRTKKAVADCEYLEALYNQRRDEYYAAQQRYADYADGNKSLYTRRSMVEGERLQNDMNQAYQVYSQVASQLQMARARIQEAKPVFAVVNPATVPVKASAPRRVMIVVLCVLLSFAVAAVWVLCGERWWRELHSAVQRAGEED